MRNANPKGAISLRFAIDARQLWKPTPSAGWRTSSNTWPSARRAIFRTARRTGSSRRGAWRSGGTRTPPRRRFRRPYQLDMPKPDQAQLKTGFGWLRDVADGIVFSDEAVNLERGVVLAEMESREPAPHRPGHRRQVPGARASDRSIASPSERGRASKPPGALDLKRFYDAWYRPEHAVVTVVGDMPVEDMRAMVESAFSSWSGRGPRPVRAKIVQPPPGRPQDALSLTDEALPTVLSAWCIRPGELRRSVRRGEPARQDASAGLAVGPEPEARAEGRRQRGSPARRDDRVERHAGPGGLLPDRHADGRGLGRGAAGRGSRGQPVRQGRAHRDRGGEGGRGRPVPPARRAGGRRSRGCRRTWPTTSSPRP